MRVIALEALDDGSARKVASALLERFGQADEDGELVAAITREAGGNPYFLRELAQSPLATPEHEAPQSGGGHPSLERLLNARIEQLPPAAKDLIEVVVLSGRPLDQRDAAAAADAAGQDRAAVALLRALRLLTVSSAGAQILVDTYHDRIRRAVELTLPAERRRERHRALAAVLEARAGTDPETLAEHHLAAGQRERAGDYSLKAAEQAARALAFDRAANLYRRSIELLSGHAAPWELEARLAEALANAGKSEEAGDAFLRASNALAVAEPAHPSLVLWKRRSFEEFLRAGRLDKGREQLEAMTALVGVPLPRTRGKKILALLLERAKLSFRKVSIADGGGDIDAKQRLRLEVCWGIAVPMSMIDPLLSNFLYTRHLLLALAQRSAHEIGRGLATEVTNLASLGGKARLDRAARLTSLLEEALNKSPDPYTASMVHAARTVVAHMSADFPASLEHGARWEEMIRSVPGASFELGTVQTFSALALGYVGRLRDMESRLAEILRENDDRGNLLHGTSLRLLETFALLRRDSRRGRAARRRRDDREVAGARLSPAALLPRHRFGPGAAVRGRRAHGLEGARGHLAPPEPGAVPERPRDRRRHALPARARGPGARAARRIAGAAAGARRQGRQADRQLGPALVARPGRARRGRRARGAQAARPRRGEAVRGGGPPRPRGDEIHAEVARRGIVLLGGKRTSPEASPMRDEGVANPERFAEMLLPGLATPSS